MDNLYDDDENAQVEESGTASDSGKSDQTEGAAEALLPKDFFGGKELKPGTRCEIEVVRVTDDQVIAKKVHESEYEDSDEADEAVEDADIEMMA